MDKVSKLGFSKNSPYKNKKKLKINSSNITMKDTEFPLLGVSNQGETQLMLPGQNYNFKNADYVMEYKLQNGGEIDSNQVKQFDKEKLKAVQLDLQTKGLYKGKIDGVYGKGTEDAIRKYNIRAVIKRDRTTKPTYENKYLQNNVEETVNPMLMWAAKNTSYEDASKLGKDVLDKLSQFSKNRPNGKMTEEERLYRQHLSNDISTVEYDPREVAKELSGNYSMGNDLSNEQIQDSYTKAFDRKYFNFYLGLPEADSSFMESPYRPTIKDKGEKLYTVREQDRPRFKQRMIEAFVNTTDQLPMVNDRSKIIYAQDEDLGQLTASYGKDERGRYLSFYDTWDLDPFSQQAKAYEGNTPITTLPSSIAPNIDKLNNPYSIYDRVYFDEIDPDYIEDVKSTLTKFKMNRLPKKQKGGYVNLLQNYLPTIPENQQDELLDTLDALPEQERYDALEEYMNGGCYKCGGKMNKGGYYDDGRDAWVSEDGTIGPNGPAFEKGGPTPTYPELGRGNVEVEDQETVKTPDGKLFKFEGNTHEQGGIQTQLPGGSIIFSDHIKAPQSITELVLGRKTNKKYSYADLSKKFPTQKSLNTLKNPDSDQFEVNTAELTLNKNQAMLDTIFGAQEAEKIQKSKSKFQNGGMTWKSNPNLLPSQIMTPDTEEQMGAFPYPTSTDPFNPENYGKGYEDVGKSYPFDSGRGSVAKYLFEQEGKIPQSTPTVQTKRPTGKGKAVKASTPTPIEDNFKASIPLPFDPLPQRNLSSQLTYSRNPFEETQTQSDTNTTSSDTEDYPGFAKSRGKGKFGINPKLAGTIMDIGLALSDNLNVEAPILFNNKTYPLFNRFVNFDNKEPGRNLALSVQQIQNSNMPEQVKQAQIAQLTAQANEQQSQVDFGNQQRYEQKQERDINKLQQYQDRNTLVGNQDLENYLQRKGRVESLKNEFKARRKSNIVNSIRGYADYADTLNLQNQIYADNYRVNPITGRVDFTGGKQDPLKQQEQLMQQYQQNVQNQISLPNGATLTMLGGDTAIVTDANGKTDIVKIK